MAAHSSILAWRIPGTEETGGLLSMGSHRVGHGWCDLACMHACIGEGNGNPRQCFCLENPRDRGAWWAAICGVAQTHTRLMWLSSSSSIPKKNGKNKNKNTSCGDVQKMFHKGVKTTKWGKQSMKQDILTKLNTHQQKNLLETLSYTIDKNELKMVQRPKPKSQMYKTRSKCAGTVSGNWTHKWFTRYNTKSTGHKIKPDIKIELYQN